MKKHSLQMLFPSKETDKPVLRFCGFDEVWQQETLGNFLKERNTKSVESSNYPLMSFVANKGVVPKSGIFDRSYLVKNSKKKYKQTELGDFIYSSNNLETGSIGLNNYGNAVISPVYSVFKSEKNINLKMLAILSEKKSFINKMLKYRQGVMYGQWKIYETDFLKINVLWPTDGEKNKIINYFEQIDKQILLYQEKIIG